MEVMAADTTPEPWTDEQWRDNLHKVFNVLGVMRSMKPQDIADAMPMPRSTFYDKLKKGTFNGLELARAARVLTVPVSVFYEPVDDLITGGLRTGSFSSPLSGLDVPTGQGSLLDDDGSPFDFFTRAALVSVPALA